MWDNGNLTIRRDEPDDRDTLYRLRHSVYACELAQHPENPRRKLSDPLDAFNQYIIAESGGEIVGFVSVTPPGHGRYSIDKYVSRDELPFELDHRSYEVRLLTVLPRYRSTPVAGLLMYAALRVVQAQGGSKVVAIGRKDVLSIYLKAGLQPVNRQIQSGAVTFELLTADVSALRQRADAYRRALDRLKPLIEWRLEVSFFETEGCYHGGAFFQAIGPRFESLQRRDEIINADVLDAWFPPAPEVAVALREHLDWIVRTSPPTRCEGMRAAIAEARHLPPQSIVPGAGSSDLIYTVFPQWLSPHSRVLLPWPTYGEYPYVLEQIVGCHVDRLRLDRREQYRLDLLKLQDTLKNNYDLVVLVNPNNPTGHHTSRRDLEPLLQQAPQKTRFWIDEAYVDYVGAGESLEAFAVASTNVVVCKTMSKGYALSGLRAGYLCCPPAIARLLAIVTRPWAVSLPGQIAAVKALQHPEYYHKQYHETHQLRCDLHLALEAIGFDVFPGSANYLFCHLSETAPPHAVVLARCQSEGLFIRNIDFGSRCGPTAIRIAVKDAATNGRMLDILRRAVRP